VRVRYQNFERLPKPNIGFRILRMIIVVSLFKKLFNRGEVDCAQTRKLASDYLENGLPPQKRSALQAHLARCGPCRAFVNTLASTIGVLSQFPRVAPPPSFKQSIIERAKADERRRTKDENS
jgi:hypothetical protein